MKYFKMDQDERDFFYDQFKSTTELAMAKASKTASSVAKNIASKKSQKVAPEGEEMNRK